MQTRRRCGHSAGMARIHRLVAGLIGRFRRAAKVRRQRHLAGSVEQLFDRRGEGQFEPLAVATGDGDAKVTTENQLGAVARRLAGAHMGKRGMRAGYPLDQDLNGTAGRLPAGKPRGNYLGVVDDQDVAGVEFVRQIGKPRIDAAIGARVDDEHAARGPLGERVAGDQLGRQLVVVLAGGHRGGW